MEENQLKRGVITTHSSGIGMVTGEMVRDRAIELAAINGHPAHEVSQSDLDQAKRELTGEPDADPKESALEAVSESERWDPVPGSVGYMAPVSPSADEDDEGRSDNQILVEDGIAQAEHDQMLLAADPAKKRNL